MDHIKRIYELLKERNLNQTEAAKIAGIPQETLSYQINKKRSKTSIDTIEILCEKVFHIDVGEFFWPKEKVAKHFKLSPEAFTAAQGIDLLPAEQKAAVLAAINGFLINLPGKQSPRT